MKSGGPFADLNWEFREDLNEFTFKQKLEGNEGGSPLDI